MFFALMMLFVKNDIVINIKVCLGCMIIFFSGDFLMCRISIFEYLIVPKTFWAVAYRLHAFSLLSVIVCQKNAFFKNKIKKEK